ncbi:MAG: 50S ribosomal protein L6 [bacterium]|nr:50S ribosomal protein L6 [bacterium]
MSRIAKNPIPIPEKTEVSYSSGTIVVKGPLGSLTKEFHPEIEVKIEDNKVILTPVRKSIDVLALWGTYASHIKNMLAGVNTPYQKKLIVEGIGFKSEVKGSELHMALGFSHPVMVKIPDDLKVTAEKNVITVSGIDCERVGQFAASVRSLKKPEPYKGKGIRYDDEVIRRKQGKKSV